MLGPDFEHYSPVETYFVNFLREPPEPTGDEPEDFVFEAPKIYEEIPRYIDTEKLDFTFDGFKATQNHVNTSRCSQLRGRHRQSPAEYGAV